MKKITIIILALFASFFGFSQTDLISNGNFHTCNENWAITGDFTYACGDDFYTHYNFSYGYGYNLQIDDASGTLGQSVQYPSNVTSAELKFYHKIATEEINNSTAFDKLTILLVSDSESYTVDELSNMDNSSSYIEKTYDIPTNLFDNETVTLAFVLDNDGAKPTRFRVDDVSLLVTTGNSGNDFNIAVENVEVSDTNPDIGQTINLSCDQIIEGDCGCSGNLDPRPDVAFGWSTSSTYNPSNFNLIDTQNSTIGSTDSGDPEDVDWTVPNSLEGQTIYIYFIPDYNDEHIESTEGEYSTVTVNVNSTNQNTDGNITVNLLPSNAVNNGAQWKTTSTTEWLNSGEILTLPFGTYSLEFKEVSGWIEPSNQTITISDSSPNYSNSFTYNEVNNSTGSISGTLINPEINDNFQIVNGSINGFVVKLFLNGNGTPIQQSNTNNSSFTFNNLEDGFYHIVAQSFLNGNVAYETQKSVTISNSNNTNISLKSSKGLINQISSLNDQLSNLSCYWSYTNTNYNLYTDEQFYSYDIFNSESYINNVDVTSIDDNHIEIIDKLSRLAIFSKATYGYYSKACELNIAYLNHIKNGTKTVFDIFSSFACRLGENPNTIEEWFNSVLENLLILAKDAVVNGLTSLDDSGELQTSFFVNTIMERMIINTFANTDLGDDIEFISDFAELLTITATDRPLTNRFLTKGYVDKTSLQFQTSLNYLINNSQSTSIEDLSYQTNVIYSDLNNFINTKISTSNNYITSPSWLNYVDQANQFVNDIYCNQYSLIFENVFNLIDVTKAGVGVYQTNLARKQYYPQVNQTLSNLYAQRNSQTENCESTILNQYITSYLNKINEFETSLNASISGNEIDMSLLNTLTIKHKELINLELILFSIYESLSENSNLSIEDYNNSVSAFKNNSMLHRTTLLILYRLYQNSDDDIFKDEIINNIDLIVSQNSSSINNLNTVYNSLNSYCVPSKLLVTKNESPNIVNTSSTNSFTFEITNVGLNLTNSVNINIESDENLQFTQSNFTLPSISNGGSTTINLTFSTATISNVSDYKISITSSDIENPIEIVNYITTIDSSSLSIGQFNLNNEFKIFPNPTNDILNLHNRKDIKIDKIKIFNTLGSLVFQSEEYKNKINVKNLQTGIYLIKLYNENKTFTYKFIKD